MVMEAGRSLLLDKDKLLTAANEAGICLVAVHREGDSPVPSRQSEEPRAVPSA